MPADLPDLEREVVDLNFCRYLTGLPQLPLELLLLEVDGEVVLVDGEVVVVVDVVGDVVVVDVVGAVVVVPVLVSLVTPRAVVTVDGDVDGDPVLPVSKESVP